MEKEPPFNKKDYSRVPENIRNIEPGKRTFKFGEIVTVKRSDQSLDGGWEIIGFNTIYGGESAKVRKTDSNGDILEKDVSIERLREWNK